MAGVRPSTRLQAAAVLSERPAAEVFRGVVVAVVVPYTTPYPSIVFFRFFRFPRRLPFALYFPLFSFFVYWFFFSSSTLPQPAIRRFYRFAASTGRFPLPFFLFLNSKPYTYAYYTTRDPDRLFMLLPIFYFFSKHFESPCTIMV